MEGGMHLAAAIHRRCLDQQLRQARPSPALQPLLPQLSSRGCQAEGLQAHLLGRRICCAGPAQRSLPRATKNTNVAITLTSRTF